MAYIPIHPSQPIYSRPSVTYEEYSEAFVRCMYKSTGRGPKQHKLEAQSMFWECAGFWSVLGGLYLLAYMTWGM